MSAPRHYRPCAVGLHVCGADHAANEFFTEANFEAPDLLTAQMWFSAAKDELAAQNGEPQDFVVDLNAGENERQVDDFPISRQMLPRLAQMIDPAQ
jgi:hypothetical protein